MLRAPSEKISLQHAIRQAVTFHQNGQLGEAERLYNGILQAEQDHFDALHLLGVLMHQRGRSAEALALIGKALTVSAQSADAFSNHGRVLAALHREDEAVASFDQALALTPDHLEALFHRGNALIGLNRSAEALASYDKVVEIKPDHVPALVNRGVALQRLQRPAEALVSFERALALNPDHVQALVNRGNALFNLKRPAEAFASYEKALAVRPNDAEALFNRGNALVELQRPVDALASYDKVLALRSGHFEALFNRGNMLRELGHHAEALASFDAALAVRSDHAALHSNRGNVLCDLNRPEDALASFEQALGLKPDQPEVLNNRANALLQLNRPAEALASYDQALAIKPDYADALVNRGNALADLRRPGEALASYDRVIAGAPDHAEARWNRSLVLLAQGDFDRGWREYESRKRRAGTAELRPFPQPLWLGDDGIEGKTILLHAEQGLGDTIQFVRYAPMVATRGAKVVLEVQDSLKALLSGVEGVSSVAGKGEPLPPFDCHCPLLSLPLAFKTGADTMPADVPYLHAPQDRLQAWRARLGGATPLRVGLAWSGSPTHRNDRNRSIALRGLAPLLAEPGVSFVSLQRETREADLAALQSHPQVVVLGHELADFADTAAVIALLDLVISVDTAVAHLAGAMGKPVWILLPYNAEWRWFFDRDDSPWYPTARLFRQPKADDWESVVARVKRELAVPLKSTVQAPAISDVS